MHALSLHRMLFSEIVRWTVRQPSESRGFAAARLLEPEMQDSKTVQRFLTTRDEGVFEVLVDRHKDRVFRLVLSVLGAGFAAEAEEVTQDVFVKVFQQLAGFREESLFSTWLYRIAFRQAVDRKRRARFRYPHVSESELTERPQAGPDPLAQAQVNERQRAVQLCLEAIPDLYRSALHLYYWMGHSVEEMAAMLGAPAGTVKSYLHRGRRMLFHELQRKGLHYGDELF
jgi:RNA polymerase sigma-70 factor, ECF subfamily